MAFDTLAKSGTSGGRAISLDNVDGGTFSGGNVTVAGTSGSNDGLAIVGGSSSTFNFASATLGGASSTSAVMAFASKRQTAPSPSLSVNINNTGGAGLITTGNTNAITINGGTIGATNDPAGIGVDVNGGTPTSPSAQLSTKRPRDAVVEVTGRTGGTVDFNGAITSSSGGGIDLTGNTGGTVRFDGGMNLSTGAAIALNSTANTGATLVVTDTASTSNILTTTTGTALNVANTTIGAEDLTFQSISLERRGQRHRSEQHRLKRRTDGHG